MKKILSALIFIIMLCACSKEEVLIPTETVYLSGEDMYVSFLKLDNGFCALLETPQKENILIGCGGNDDFPYLYEFLRSRNVSELDIIILISDNPSCIGGFEKVVSNFETDKVYVGEDFADLDSIRKMCVVNSPQGTELFLAAEGTRIYDGDDVTIDAVSSRLCDTPYGRRSAVSLYAVYRGNAVFIEGDGDYVAERDIIKTMGLSLDADIICVPHSATTDLPSKELLDIVKPKYAVIPVYSDNYPLMSLTKRFEEKGIEWVRTDSEGTIIFTIDGKNIKYHIQK